MRGLPILLVLAACAPATKPAPSHGFLGAAACAECHAERWDTFRHTAHHLTSRLPSAESIRGSFAVPANVLATANPNLVFEMTADASGFRETAKTRDAVGEHVRSERIDLVVGSGHLGQTYLSWRGRELFELPVSYLAAADRWINSPGGRYVDGTADFDRPIPPRCLDCHATWAAADSNDSHAYDPADVVLGISCERCHGPGADHVAWHRANPADRTPRAIVRPAEFSRERSLELCGQCHGGVGKLVAPAFSYRPGEPLDRYVLQAPAPDSGHAGMHSANQFVRLQKSRCFEESGALTCTRCHDPHVVERHPERISKRCLTCHEVKACGMASRVGAGIAAACVACHMPRQDETGTVFQTGGTKEHPTMTDHMIRIDRGASERFLASPR